MKRSEALLELRTTLSAGSRGGQVKMVQDYLHGVGLFEGVSDGHYGIRLSKAVRQFQQHVGLNVTGDVNPRTWEAMFSGPKD